MMEKLIGLCTICLLLKTSFRTVSDVNPSHLPFQVCKSIEWMICTRTKI